MATVEELVIKATPEGIDETVEGLEQMEAKTEDSAESMEDQADAMGDLTNKFAGAMAAISAGFAVVAGTLLSKVPVLGEVAAGVGAVLTALGLKMDTVLRPVLQPLAQGFFILAQKINNTEGPAGKLIGIATTLGTALAGVASFVVLVGTAVKVLSGFLIALGGAGISVTGIVLGFFSALTTLAGAITTVASLITGVFSTAIVGLLAKFGLLLIKGGVIVASVLKPLAAGFVALVSGVSALTIGIALLIAAIVGFIAAYITNWKGARTKTNRILNQIKNIVINAFDTFILDSLESLAAFVTIAGTKFAEMRKNTVDEFNMLIEDASQFGTDFVNGFAEGIRNAIGNATAAAGEVASEVRERLPGSPAETGPLSDLDETGPGLVNTFSAGIEANVGTIKRSSDTLAEGAQPAANALSRQEGKTILEIEGRQVERATRSFRSDGTDLRGRYG